MPRATTSWTLRGVSGKAAIAASAVLGVLALCLVLFGASQKQVQLGVLLGLWAALIAAFLLVDRSAEPALEPAAELDQARARAAELHEAHLKVVASQQEQLEAARQAYFAQEIELRRFSELQLARDASARRESELTVEVSLRREVERVLVEQLGSLREEVAALRAEVVDKLGGQLRLERIETTRVIGSDLEALQHEIRRLAASRTDGIAATGSVTPAGSAAQAGSVAAAASVAQAGSNAPAASIASSPTARPGQDTPGDIVDAELVDFPPPAIALPSASSASAQFVGLPRLSPPREDLGLLPDPGLTEAERAEQRPGRRHASDSDRMSEALWYQGRRRADGDPAGWFARLDG